jgi:hypothetical protein
MDYRRSSARLIPQSTFAEAEISIDSVVSKRIELVGWPTLFVRGRIVAALRVVFRAVGGKERRAIFLVQPDAPLHGSLDRQ